MTSFPNPEPAVFLTRDGGSLPKAGGVPRRQRAIPVPFTAWLQRGLRQGSCPELCPLNHQTSLDADPATAAKGPGALRGPARQFLQRQIHGLRVRDTSVLTNGAARGPRAAKPARDRPSARSPEPSGGGAGLRREQFHLAVWTR